MPSLARLLCTLLALLPVWGPVPSTAADLVAVNGRIGRAEPWYTLARSVLEAWYVDAARGRVVVEVSAASSALRSAARAAFGTAVELVVRPAGWAGSWTRQADYRPWIGGSLLARPGTSPTCTAGYAVRNVLSQQRALVTAGHCFNLGDTVVNNGATVGTVTYRTLNNYGYDFAMIAGTQYKALVYVGPATGSIAWPVRGSHKAVVGDTLCFDGAFTGENCSAQVDATDICVRLRDGVTRCHVNRAHSTTGTRLGRGGDSGGPVVAYDMDGLKMAGLILGGSGDGSEALFHDVVVPGWPAVGWQLDTA